MLNIKLGIRTLGLCVVLVAIAIFTSVAQAETNAFWLVNGAKLAGGLTPTVEAETETVGAFLTELGGKQIHIRCTITLLLGHIVAPGQFLGKELYHGCKFFELVTINGQTKEIPACGKDLVETNTVTALLKLHEGKSSLEVKPSEAGKPLATLTLGEECAFGEKITIEGTLFLKDAALSTNAVKHLAEELKALTKLTVNGGAKTATLDGSSWIVLGGAHKGLTFSGQPG